MLLLGIFILNLLVSHEDFQNEAVPSEQPISHLKSGHYSWTEKDIINDFNVLFWFPFFLCPKQPWWLYISILTSTSSGRLASRRFSASFSKMTFRVCSIVWGASGGSSRSPLDDAPLPCRLRFPISASSFNPTIGDNNTLTWVWLQGEREKKRIIMSITKEEPETAISDKFKTSQQYSRNQKCLTNLKEIQPFAYCNLNYALL